MFNTRRPLISPAGVALALVCGIVSGGYIFSPLIQSIVDEKRQKSIAASSARDVTSDQQNKSETK